MFDDFPGVFLLYRELCGRKHHAWILVKYYILMIENHVQRIGATGASEVKQHSFFKDINWDTLARQKAMFVPSTEGAFDTSYFMSRYVWNPEEDHVTGSSDFDYMSESGGSDTFSSGSCSNPAGEDLELRCQILTYLVDLGLLS